MNVLVARKVLARLLAASAIAAALCVLVAALFKPDAESSAPSTAKSSTAGAVLRVQPPGTLRVTNECGFEVWVAQENLPGVKPLTRLAENDHTDLSLPPAGVPSVRLWARAGCSDAGTNCVIGQSDPPCPAYGCAPPVDSKLEATFPCVLADKSACAKNPSSPDGGRLDGTLWWNASAVDGYTLPFAVRVSDTDAGSCSEADCSKLLLSACPTHDDLSNHGANPDYANVSEKVRHPSSETVSGCFAPFMKLNYPGWGGLGLEDPNGPVERMYGCPTPPISPGACRGGPVTETEYVKLVHRACANTVYAYAYDDALGLRSCPSGALLELVFCPREPTR